MSEDTSCGVGSEWAAEVHGSEGTEHLSEPVCTSTLAAAWISRGHTGLPPHTRLSEMERGRE